MFILCVLHSKDKKAKSGQRSTHKVQRERKKPEKCVKAGYQCPSEVEYIGSYPGVGILVFNIACAVILTTWNRVLPEKLKCPKLLKEFPAFYGTLRFIPVYTRACHLFLS
jgi:hypothetical protein